MPTFVAITPIAGANLNATTTDRRFELGTVASGTQDTEWVYVEANGAISAGDICEINASGTATRATTAGPRTSVTELGAAQNAFATGEFGWIARRGYNLTVAISATTQPRLVGTAELYIATTSGKLSNTSASATVAGILINNGSATATTTTTTGTLTWPRIIVSG